jgi:hypothetical protein
MTSHFWNEDGDEVSRDDVAKLDRFTWSNEDNDSWMIKREDNGRWSVWEESAAHRMATGEAWKPTGTYATRDAAIAAVVGGAR